MSVALPCGGSPDDGWDRLTNELISAAGVGVVESSIDDPAFLGAVVLVAGRWWLHLPPGLVGLKRYVVVRELLARISPS
ncbi:hypothetical protein PUR59_00440 [Streptomyces sp. SP18ES09]|uniref:hypothetical protein n=1 Tax=Streptomyces sp. SP18ES09 TaxID=3002532 RepID=UPI002E797308|nr:hypothetical protein [Streptomyces sp. SP18ES09]MEE1813519.1 hypothetical protein [Streptomyces sp. SP18ES09]